MAHNVLLAPTSYRRLLELDVQRLHEILYRKTQLRYVLEKALENVAALSSDIPWLSSDAKELVSSIAMLETDNVRLEQEMDLLRLHLTQERNERKLIEYRLRKLASRDLLIDFYESMKLQGPGNGIINVETTMAGLTP